MSVFSGKGKRQNKSMVPCWPQQSDDILPQFRTHRIGGLTSYQLLKKEQFIKQIFSSIGLVNGDWVLLAFGEIDCRVHLARRIKAGDSPAKVIQECAIRYGQALASYKTWWNNLIIYGPIASSPNKERTEEDWIPNENFPAYGDCQFRNRITMSYTKVLASECNRLGLKFYSIMPMMVDAEMITNPYYLMDDIHLSQTALPLLLTELVKLEVLDSTGP